MLGELDAAEQIYYSRNGKFHAGTDGQQASAALGVDFKNNKYFTSWYPVNGGTNDTFSEELHRKKKVLKYMDHVLGDNPVMKYKPGKKH